MAQQIWEMDSLSGEHYTLGLYHGEETGHLVVYLNNEIFLIDFNILEEKNYNFFIGNEFMKLTICPHNNSYKYLLNVDTETPTPLNAALKKSKNQDENLLLTGLILTSILLIIFFIFNYIYRYSI